MEKQEVTGFLPSAALQQGRHVCTREHAPRDPFLDQPDNSASHLAVTAQFSLLQDMKPDDRSSPHLSALRHMPGSAPVPWLKQLVGRVTLSHHARCAGVLMRALVLLVIASGAALAGNWEKTNVPAYAKSVQVLAIGDDGAFYSVSSNRHGYFFQSVLATYRFDAAVGGEGSGQLMARRTLVFLAESCDAYMPETSGSWTSGGSPRTFRFTAAGGRVITFQLLSESPEPGHAC